MEQTPYQRLEIFWQSKGLKNMSAFAEAIKLSPGTVSAIKLRGSRPSNVVMLAIQKAFPDLNPEWALWGTGPMLRDGRALTPAPLLPTADEPAPAYLAAAADPMVGKLLDQLHQKDQAHREDLRKARKDAERRLTAQAKHWQFTVDVMERQYKDLETQVAELKRENFALKLAAGQRLPTPEEEEAFEKAAEARKAKEEKQKQRAGFKPEGVVAGMALSYHNPDFIRPLPFDQEEVSHLQAA